MQTILISHWGAASGIATAWTHPLQRYETQRTGKVLPGFFPPALANLSLSNEGLCIRAPRERWPLAGHAVCCLIAMHRRVYLLPDMNKKVSQSSFQTAGQRTPYRSSFSLYHYITEGKSQAETVVVWVKIYERTYISSSCVLHYACGNIQSSLLNLWGQELSATFLFSASCQSASAFSTNNSQCIRAPDAQLCYETCH